MAGGTALMGMGMGNPSMGGGGIYGPGGGMNGGMGGGMGHMGGMGGMPMGAPVMGAMQTTGGGEAKQCMEVPKMIVGKIIGRGGETITMIQRKSGARAQLDQAVPEGMPCKVNITGTPQAVAACAQIIQEIMMGVPLTQVGANLPAPGAAQASPYGASPYGGMGAYGMGQMPGMPGMGMPGQPMMQYGAYGAYGAPQGMMPQQQQQYAMGGGYQAYGAAAGAGAAQGMYGMPQQAYAQPGMVQQQAAAKPVAASPWTEHKTDDGVTYWYNSTTGVSQVTYQSLNPSNTIKQILGSSCT